MAKYKPYRIFIYAVARLGAWLLYLLPRPALMWMARRFGEVAYLVAFKHRNNTLLHLRNALGDEKNDSEIRRIARGVFRNMAQTGVEMLKFPSMTPQKINKMIDEAGAYERYKTLLEEGKGLIIVTSHIGNWELLGALPAAKGLKSKAIARKMRYPRFHNWVESLRRSAGVELIYRDQSPKVIIRWLREGGALGILPDQDIDSLNGVFVNFFGRPAYTSVAPVKLSPTTGAPIATVFLIRLPGDRYRVVFDEVLRPVLQDSQEATIQKHTALWMASCERIIRQYPEQWGWVHNRWKTQPQ